MAFYYNIFISTPIHLHTCSSTILMLIAYHLKCTNEETLKKRSEWECHRCVTLYTYIVDIRAGIIFFPPLLVLTLFFIIFYYSWWRWYSIQWDMRREIYWSVFLCEAFMKRIDKVSGVLHTYWVYKDKKNIWICCTYVCI
jgi:hypothetical protein